MSTCAIDRESFQKLLASAFAIQQSQMDSESLSALVELKRLTTRGELDEVDGANNTSGVAIGPSSGTQVLSCATEFSTPPPEEEPRTAADSMDACFAGFRVRSPEVKTAQFRFRDPWMPLLVILVSALALLLGWMLGRVTWPGTAHTKGPPAAGSVSRKAEAPPTPLVTANVDAATEKTQAEASPPPAIPPKARSPEAPSDGLIVYQDGKIIFRLKPSKEVGPSSPNSGETIPDPSQDPGEPSAQNRVPGSPGKADVQLLRLVEPEYPEAARQQHIQGPVVLEAKVSKDGAVQQLTVISGNSMLATSACGAVLQWRFKPIAQNGQVVQFQARIKVDFVLP
ncbi:MAG: TonB family protein [Candidatus Sulfotelmatobacter sp.]|jgi:TonB family protein